MPLMGARAMDEVADADLWEAVGSSEGGDATEAFAKAMASQAAVVAQAAVAEVTAASEAGDVGEAAAAVCGSAVVAASWSWSSFSAPHGALDIVCLMLVALLGLLVIIARSRAQYVCVRRAPRGPRASVRSWASRPSLSSRSSRSLCSSWSWCPPGRRARCRGHADASKADTGSAAAAAAAAAVAQAAEVAAKGAADSAEVVAPTEPASSAEPVADVSAEEPRALDMEVACRPLCLFVVCHR